MHTLKSTFYLYDSVSLDRSIKLGSYHHNQDGEQLIITFILSQTWTLGNHWSAHLCSFAFPRKSLEWNDIISNLWLWLPSLLIMHMRFLLLSVTFLFITESVSSNCKTGQAHSLFHMVVVSIKKNSIWWKLVENRKDQINSVNTWGCLAE